MDTEALVTQLPALHEELKRWREKEAEAHRKVESLERIIIGIEGLRPGATELPQGRLLVEPTSTPADNGSEGPRGIAAVRRVMLREPERIWRAKEIHAELQKRGWLSPEARWPERGTEAAINRLWKRREVERVATGRYRVTDEMRRDETQD